MRALTFSRLGVRSVSTVFSRSELVIILHTSVRKQMKAKGLMLSFVWTLVYIAVSRVTAERTKWQDGRHVDYTLSRRSPYSEVGVLVFKNDAESRGHREACTGSVVNTGSMNGDTFIDVLTAAHCLRKQRYCRLPSCLSTPIIDESYDLKFYQGINVVASIADAFEQRMIEPTHDETIAPFQYPFGFTGLNKRADSDDPKDMAIVRFKGTSTSRRTLPIGSDTTAQGATVGDTHTTLRNVVYDFLDRDPRTGKSKKTLSGNGLEMIMFWDIQPVRRDGDLLRDEAFFCVDGMSGSPLMKFTPSTGAYEIVGILSGIVKGKDVWARIDADRKRTLEEGMLVDPFDFDHEPKPVIGSGEYGIVGGGMGSEDEPKSIIVIDSLAGLVFLIFIICSFGVGLGILSNRVMQRFENMNRVQVYEMKEVKV